MPRPKPRLHLLLLAIAALVAPRALGQPLDISTVLPVYSSDNPLVTPGTYGGEFRSTYFYQPLSSLNFLDNNGGSTFVFLGNLYPRLMQRSVVDTSIHCNLCLDYVVSSDGTRVTFTLRDGIRWSDGEPLTARDVAFTAGVYAEIDPAAAPSLANLHNAVHLNGARLEVEAVDEKTVVMRLPNPLPEELWMDKAARLYVLPEHVFGPVYASGGLAAAQALYPLGSSEIVSAGPWTFASFSNDYGIVLEENREGSWLVDAFGNRLPYLDRYIIRMHPERSAAELFVGGKADFLLDMRSKDVFRRAEASGAVIEEIRNGRYALDEVVPNFQAPDAGVAALMRHIDFRVAMSVMFDREAYVERVYGQMGVPVETYMVLPGYRDLPYPRRGYQPKSAGLILASLGLARDPARTACPDGCYAFEDGTPLILRFLYADLEDLSPKVEAIAELFREAGLEVVPYAASPEELFGILFTPGSSNYRDFELLYNNVAPSVDIPLFAYIFGLDGAYRPWSHLPDTSIVQPWEERLSELTLLLETDLPDARRVAIIAEATVILAEQLPMIVLAQQRIFQAYSPNLANTLDQVMAFDGALTPAFLIDYQLIPLLLHQRRAEE